MIQPFVSIVLTTYNGSSRGYLNEAIESVLGQTYTQFELIIIDDGSADSTGSDIQKFLSDPRVRYHFQENKGLPAARNAGIRLSRYDYLCFLDDDDAYEPEKLTKQISFFNDPSHSDTAMVYTGLFYIDEKNRCIGSKIHPARGDIYEHLFYGNSVCAPSSCMIKKEAFDRIGLFDETLKSCEDYDLWLRLAKHHAIYSIDECLVRYRIHQNKMSTDYKKMHYYQEYVLSAALKNAPADIQAKKHEYYHQYHIGCAHQYLGIENFTHFRRHFKQAQQFGKSSVSWHLRYMLTFFPLLFRVLKKLKNRINPLYGFHTSL